MANRNFSEVQGLARKQIVLAGSVSLAADASVSSQDFLGASVAKTGTGEYTITLEDSYQKLLGASVQVGLNPAASSLVQAVDVVSAKTIVVETIVAGVAADVAALTDLYVTLVLSNSSVN